MSKSVHNEIRPISGPEPAILEWYGHCVRLSVNKARGIWGHAPPGRFFKIRYSEIASEAMFGQNATRISPPVVSQGRRSRGGRGGECPPKVQIGGALPPQSEDGYCYLMCNNIQQLLSKCQCQRYVVYLPYGIQHKPSS